MKGDTVLGTSVGLFALAAIIYTRTFPEMLVAGIPSAAFFPIVSGCGVIISCVVIIIQGFRSNKGYFTFSQDIKGYLLMAETIAVTILYIALIGKLHFVMITTVYIIALGLLFGMKWKILIPCSVATSVALFWIFNSLLNVMLNG